MTQLLDDAVQHIRTLTADEQDSAAVVLMALANDRHEYTFDKNQIDGIHHAVAQADARQFASDERLRKIFGGAL